MIVIRTNHDLQTNYLYEYTKPVIKVAENKGFEVTILEGKEISEAILRKRIKNRKPKIIFFNGHGSEDALYADKKTIFIDTKSADVFKETITFTRACDSLLGLGKEAIKKGCFAFIGYKKKFFIARHHSTTCIPNKDQVAKPILECSNMVINELLKGKSVKQAVETSHVKATDHIVTLIYSKEPSAAATLSALIYNDQALSFEGDENKTI